ncbi:hypothetical protein KQ51_01673 [Candidatus Izimaplasma bacterium HR1]|uniref:hypothetical protein n=1 Tax=Candidatus Izimoplasma sp. HR1 TaxID=1541959 RepID=UPI0004F62AAD|nr:hypothetical protein KQ51_01673 [Candidatus Izimaplasma bacterium HR1]
MELYHYIIIAVVAIVAVVVSVVLLNRSKVEKKQYELPTILELLNKKNIVGIDFIRNKIVINFNDVTLFNTDLLLEKGAKGISIVGNKVKFYFDGDNELNENIYKQIKQFIEG